MPAAAVRPAGAKKPAVDQKQDVDILGLVEVLQNHVTETLCEEVFEQTRDKERQRAWSLHALVWFWMAVTLRAPKTLTEVLDESRKGGDNLVPEVPATSEAFFEKCKGWRPDFFAELFTRVGSKLLPEAPAIYAQQVAELRKHFPEIWVMDGSQLAEVAHRLKILRKVQGAVLPGRLMAFYDIFRGLTRALAFEPDAARNENLLAKEALEHVPEGTLLVGDRLYGMPTYFAELAKRKAYGVFRRNATPKVEVVEVLSRKRDGRVLLEDVLVRLGSGSNGAPRPLVRLIRYRARKKKLDLFVSVLEPTKLPAQKAVELYGLRWGVERMFYDLKEVLNLNRFYAGNPNAVAMQIYAATLVYNAFRVIQGRIAQAHEIAPEWISPKKLFPKVAATAIKLAHKEEAFLDIAELNPGVKLVKPTWRNGKFGQTTLESILVRPKFAPHTRARYKPHSVWLSFRHIRGGGQFLKKLS